MNAFGILDMRAPRTLSLAKFKRLLTSNKNKWMGPGQRKMRKLLYHQVYLGAESEP